MTLLALLLAMTAPAFALNDTGKVCVADLGSNSLKIEVGEILEGGYVQHHLSKKVVGVGDDMSSTGVISEAKLAEIGKVLASFARTCEKHGAASRYAVATAAYREAKNGSSVVEVAGRHGFKLEVASAERESQLAYLSCTLGKPGQAVLDIGSRTVELVTLDERGGYRHTVHPLGYRVSFKGFFAEARTFREAAAAYRAALAKELADVSVIEGKPALYGLEIGKPAHFLLGKGPVHEARLSAEDISKRLKELEEQPAASYAALKRRKDVDGVLPRLVLLEHVLKLAGHASITVVDRELGAGVIAELAR